LRGSELGLWITGEAREVRKGLRSESREKDRLLPIAAVKGRSASHALADWRTSLAKTSVISRDGVRALDLGKPVGASDAGR